MAELEALKKASASEHLEPRSSAFKDMPAGTKPAGGGIPRSLSDVAEASLLEQLSSVLKTNPGTFSASPSDDRGEQQAPSSHTGIYTSDDDSNSNTGDGGGSADNYRYFQDDGRPSQGLRFDYHGYAAYGDDEQEEGGHAVRSMDLQDDTGAAARAYQRGYKAREGLYSECLATLSVLTKDAARCAEDVFQAETRGYHDGFAAGRDKGLSKHLRNRG